MAHSWQLGAWGRNTEDLDADFADDIEEEREGTHHEGHEEHEGRKEGAKAQRKRGREIRKDYDAENPQDPGAPGLRRMDRSTSQSSTVWGRYEMCGRTD